ncbi:MAG: hypothetical protein IPQ16_14940 [Geobacteraceae bacterium]|nr:hypothetical protein [Geobacteraceae bacterium]
MRRATDACGIVCTTSWGGCNCVVTVMVQFAAAAASVPPARVMEVLAAVAATAPPQPLTGAVGGCDPPDRLAGYQ